MKHNEVNGRVRTGDSRAFLTLCNTQKPFACDSAALRQYVDYVFTQRCFF